MALDGNERWCYLDPKLGASHAVAEAARKVACTGATPVAATNCLNFGNPEKPEIMAQLSLAIDGISAACVALGTPITGGNVSLYNETRGQGIYPTPVIGIVGILDQVNKAVGADFQRAGDAISDGGLAAALAEACIGAGLGAAIAIGEVPNPRVPGSPWEMLFSEPSSAAVVSCGRAHIAKVMTIAQRWGLYVRELGEVGGDSLQVSIDTVNVISAPVAELGSVWSASLESLLAEEVTA
jgi:phosphoribosylformylglycinamidine (FGAM) synthase-like enzyme